VGPVDTTPDGTSRPDEVVDALRWQRSVVAPALGPIDKLRLELDEALPGGAGLARREGRLLLAGVGRIMDRSTVAVHADAGRRDCMTANVYLRMPTRRRRHHGLAVRRGVPPRRPLVPVPAR
jgi:hypothetical protein